MYFPSLAGLSVAIVIHKTDQVNITELGLARPIWDKHGKARQFTDQARTTSTKTELGPALLTKT